MSDDRNQGQVWFNRFEHFQSVTATSPEQITEIISKIKVPLQVIQIVADSNGHTCYFVTNKHLNLTIKKKGANNG